MTPLLLALPILAILVTLSLGLLVFLSDSKNKINRAFSLFAFGGAIWIFSVFMADFTKSLNFALFWTRMSIVGPAIFSPFLVYFSLIFPFEKIRIRLWQIVLLFSPSLIFLILAPTNFNVKKVWFESWGTNFQPGFLYYLLIIYIIFYFGLAFKNLFGNYKKVSGVAKLQIRYIFLGFFLGVLIGLNTNAILPLLGYAQLSSVGPTFSFISLVIFTTYAIVKKELFGIKLILTSLFVGMIATLLLLDILVFTSQTFLKSWKGLILVIFIYFGYLLVKSVLIEIQYRERLQKAYEDLKVLDKAKSEFISMASHQLRTPLSAIKGYISMLIDGSYGKIPAKAEEKLKNVFQSNERLIRVVNDLLDISKIEMGKMELEKTPTQIEEMVQSCYEEMKIGAEHKKLKFIFKKPENPLPKIEIDALKMRQVILNLIDNAIRYTQKGEIELKVERAGASVRISVKDTGEGMSSEEQKNIFERFSRGSAGLAYFVEGAGLGLYTAQKFLELHKGRIWAESEGKGKGSTFFVELPIK